MKIKGILNLGWLLCVIWRQSYFLEKKQNVVVHCIAKVEHRSIITFGTCELI